MIEPLVNGLRNSATPAKISNIMSEQTVELDDITVEAETDLALLCTIDDKKHWIPKSVVHEDSEVSGEGDTGTIIIMRWFAEKKGWCDRHSAGPQPTVTMVRYLCRDCPHCNGYVGITIREPARNTPVQAVDGPLRGLRLSAGVDCDSG